MRICGRCKAAENPHGNLRFIDSPDGALCEECYPKQFDVPQIPAEDNRGKEFAVIPCPICPTRHNGHKGLDYAERPCKTCAGYGSVRVKLNALPVYTFPAVYRNQGLTED